MSRFHQRGRPDSVAPWASSSYSESDGEDHSSEAALTPPSSDEHSLPSKIRRRTVSQIVEAINLCITSLEAFTHDDPAYVQLNELLGLLNNGYMESVHKGDHESAQSHGLVGDFLQEWFDHDQQDHGEHYDGSPEASDKTRRIMRSCAPTGSIGGSFVSVASELGNIRSPAKKLNQDVGDMYGQHSESHVPRLRNSETQSLSYTDDVVPLLVGDHIAPSTEQDRGQGAEGFEKKWSTVKANTADTKSNTADTVRSPLRMEERDSYWHLFNAYAVGEAKDREAEQYVAAASPADNATDNRKPAATKLHRSQERLGMVHDNLSKSDPKIVPVIVKSGHPAKASDVKTATSFSSPHNPTAPDDSIIDEFLEVANNSFTREEAFEILRMCGANLVAAVSVYRNAMGPEHLRQMLRAWLVPLENAEFRTAARFYTESVDNQGNPWGVSSEKEVRIGADKCQPTLPLMNVEEAFEHLKPDVYNSVDFDLLQKELQVRLSWEEGFPEAQQQLQQAYDTIFQHQNDNNCWKLCPVPWTKVMDEKLMKLKNEDANMRWGAIADTLGMTVHECRDRFEVLKRVESKSNEPKECKSKEQQQKDTVKATAVRIVTPELGAWDSSDYRYCQKCDAGYHSHHGHVCEADRAASDGDQPLWGSIATPTNPRKPKVPVPAAIFEKIEKLDEQLKQQLNELKTAKVKSNYKSAEDVDKETARLQKQIDTGIMKLVDEKKVLAEISALNKAKKKINVIKAQIAEQKKLLDDPKNKAYAVTYWATIESGDEMVHIPVNSSNVSGPEKAIIEGSVGMKNIWRWVQDKGLSDKVGLQDAFDFAKDMHGEDEDEELVIEKPMPAEATSRAHSRSSVREWAIPETYSLFP